MSVFRTRQDEKLYQKYLANSPEGCDFCRIAEEDPQLVTATRSFKIIYNRFPYTVWDGQRVSDHLMVVPKVHTGSMASFTPEQASEYLALISEYENNGYHVYARAVKSVARTILHQHTHLIKGTGKPLQLEVMISKPHILIAR